jgi:hypothetical protein
LHFPEEKVKTVSYATSNKQSTEKKKCTTGCKTKLTYKKHLEAVEALRLTNLPPFYDNGHNSLPAEELIEEVEDLGKIADWSGEAKS